MKKKVALLLVLLSSLAMAQQNALVIQQTFSAATTYPVSTGLPVAGYTNHTLTWSQVGSTTITGCLVQVDSSPTGTGSWTAAGVIASQACNSSGTITITSSTASYIRINVTAITAGTVKVTYSAVNGALAMNSAVNITGTAAGITGYSIGTAPGNILTNPCFSAYQLPYEGPTGLTCLTGPAGPDGVAQVPCIQSSGGLPTAYTLCMASVVEDATNPATLPVTDRGKLVYWTGGAAFALPPISQVPATGTGLSLHFPFFNDTATAVVVTPNVGVNDLCNGAVTCTVPPYYYAVFSQDTTSGPGHWHMEALATVLSNQLAINVLPKSGGAGTAYSASSITDNATTVTTTDTGGWVGPTFTANGSTAGFTDYPQGTTSAAVAPCNVATSICIQAPAAVTSYVLTMPAAAPTVNNSFKLTSTAGVESYTATIPSGSDPNASIRNFNSALQSQTVVSATEYYITNSNLNMPAVYNTAIGAGTAFRWHIQMQKTAAGTGSFQILLKKGTNGTIGDTSIVTQVIGATQTAAVDNLTLDITLTWTSATAAYWSISPRQLAASAAGFGLVFPAVALDFNGTISAQTTTTASDKYGISFISTTGTPTITVSQVQAQAYGVN